MTVCNSGRVAAHVTRVTFPLNRLRPLVALIKNKRMNEAQSLLLLVDLNKPLCVF